MSEIPPDLASKVMSADLRNLVKKVSEGSSLTHAEREMMERAVIDGTLQTRWRRVVANLGLNEPWEE